MVFPEMGERTVKLIVVGFSLIGLLVLGTISYMTEVPRIDISEAPDHIGERVEISGTVLGEERSSSGACSLMVIEGNDTLEIYIERSDRGYEPGMRITATGELSSFDGAAALTVQTDRSVNLRSSEEASPDPYGVEIGAPVVFECAVRSIGYTGWDSIEITADPIIDIDATNEGSVLIEAQGIEERIRAGDILQVMGLKRDDRCFRTYGSTSIIILSRTESRTLSLLRFLDDVRFSPDGAPLGPVTLEGFLKYEPSGRSIYIADAPEGSTISIKARLPEADPCLYRGDLVLLENCSMVWEGEGLRFHLEPERYELIEAHGPWTLNLDSLEGGVNEYLGSVVIMEGEVRQEGDDVFLIDGRASVELRNCSMVSPGLEAGVQGKVSLDTARNVLYIEVSEVRY
ncbi:MAG: hypothetical protein ACMUHB_01485 [Thermoplasmatota archaeon]